MVILSLARASGSPRQTQSVSSGQSKMKQSLAGAAGTHPQRWFFPLLSSQPLSTQFSPTLLRAIYQKAPQVIVNPVIQGRLLAVWAGQIRLPNSRKYLKTRMDGCFHVAGPNRSADKEVVVIKIYTYPAGAERLQESCDSLKFKVNWYITRT